uniref:CMP/dCMP-type deaminase domain-containing protein n=1 Tax=Anopheles atroparvus TaxID=41427 RepID=A0A182J4Z9_ANOAO
MNNNINGTVDEQSVVEYSTLDDAVKELIQAAIKVRNNAYCPYSNFPFTTVAVVAYQEAEFTAPCGVCRQTLSEFSAKDLPIYLAKPAPVRVMIRCHLVCDFRWLRTSSISTYLEMPSTDGLSSSSIRLSMLCEAPSNSSKT